jgi:predicted O-methyltransferase YrrM
VYLGFSSMMWSFAVGTDGIVTGLEYDPKYVQLAGLAFEEYCVKNCKIVLGGASKT